MLINETVTDTMLHRGTPRFPQLVRDHLIVSMGSTAPGYSQALATDIDAAAAATSKHPYRDRKAGGSRRASRPARRRRRHHR
jgi:3-hydroxyisobutyrate dehydrogenase